MEWGLEWIGCSEVFLGRSRAKVFVVERVVCWALGGELGIE